MEDSEPTIAIVKDLYDPQGFYNVHLTDERMIFIFARETAAPGSPDAISLFTSVFAGYKEAKRQEKIGGLTPSQIVAVDKKSFAIDYSDVIEIKMTKPSNKWKREKLEIRLASGKTRQFYPNEKQFTQLANLLPTIPKIASRFKAT